MPSTILKFPERGAIKRLADWYFGTWYPGRIVAGAVLGFFSGFGGWWSVAIFLIAYTVLLFLLVHIHIGPKTYCCKEHAK